MYNHWSKTHPYHKTMTISTENQKRRTFQVDLPRTISFLYTQCKNLYQIPVRRAAIRGYSFIHSYFLSILCVSLLMELPYVFETIRHLQVSKLSDDTSSLLPQMLKLLLKIRDQIKNMEVDEQCGIPYIYSKGHPCDAAVFRG